MTLVKIEDVVKFYGKTKALCDRVGILKEGVKIFDGTVESLKAQTGENSFEDAFVKISAETREG